jgi:hypothetical protein
MLRLKSRAGLPGLRSQLENKIIHTWQKHPNNLFAGDGGSSFRCVQSLS